MNEIQDVKNVLSASSFEKRAKSNPRRLYGFLLCTDEHVDFLSFVQKSWRTLDALSGESCDIFTLEKWEMPHDRLKSKRYIKIDGGDLGAARIARGDQYGFGPQDIAIDNGIMLPDRVQCFKVRDKLFENPSEIILPGFAIFPSVAGKKARYYRCGELNPGKLSELYQVVLTTIAEKYRAGSDSEEIFEAFCRAETIRKVKQYAIDAVLKLSVMDLIKLIGGGLGLVLPKSAQSRSSDD